MKKPAPELSDIIAAAALTSSVSRKKSPDSPHACTGDCTDCPFSLPAFGLALRQAEKRGHKLNRTKT